MSTTTLSSQHSGSVPAALRTGLALAVTVAVFYALCALVWLAAPGEFLNFMNGLFHGMDFSPLVQQRPFGWAGFLVVLLVLGAWALLAGAFFAWVFNRLTR